MLTEHSLRFKVCGVAYSEGTTLWTLAKFSGERNLN